MTAVLAPALWEEDYAVDYAALAPNHPAVRSKSGQALPGWSLREQPLGLRSRETPARKTLSRATRPEETQSRLHLVTSAEASSRSISLSWQALAGRAVLFVLALVVAVILGSLVGIGLDPSFGMEPVDYFSHTVVPGDNLWNLAATNAGSLPTDEMVAQIMSMNRLDAASVLTAGQEILIPVF